MLRYCLANIANSGKFNSFDFAYSEQKAKEIDAEFKRLDDIEQSSFWFDCFYLYYQSFVAV